MKYILRSLCLIGFAILSSCGAVPGQQSFSTAPDMPRARYVYLDAWGNQYVITQNKLEYTPVSEENSIDDLKDQGRYAQLNITLNEYGKIASVCDRELAREQAPLSATRDSLLPIPMLTKTLETTESLELDLDGVRELNFILKPYLKPVQ